MITYNLQADNGNYYRGHKPDNKHGNCWAGNRDCALTFTLEQARGIVKHRNISSSGLNIVISIESEPISNDEYNREMFCLVGNYYCNWEKETKDGS